MVDLNKLMTKTDDIYENCYNAIAGTATLPNEFSDMFSAQSPFLLNILYNFGYMFTDILDLFFYDPENTNPYWYYVGFRLGDFSIRFIYRDSSTTTS